MTAIRSMFWRRPLAAIAVALTVASCGMLPGTGEPPQVFVLTAKSTFAPDLPRVDWQLTIDLPTAEAGLNSARIALQRSRVTLEYYAHANWVDTAPAMVQKLLVESFENTGRIVSVGRQSVALRSDFSLLIDLREFQAEYLDGGTPKAHVRMNAKLVKMPQRTIVATFTAEHFEAASSGDLPSVVLAFDEALGKVMRRIVEWTFRAATNTARS
ncbi:MAG: hypothetical protein FJX67_10230 [Alphaproteobacteria bacterium]|nr:hypothetical protein [Alphaproteobacteria bacterium]